MVCGRQAQGTWVPRACLSLHLLVALTPSFSCRHVSKGSQEEAGPLGPQARSSSEGTEAGLR